MKGSPKSTASLRRRASIIAIAAVSAGCGTSELDVEPAFDGTWDVVELASDGEMIDLQDQPIVIEIDTVEAAVRGQTTCQRLFGSYTLTPAGDASFTIPSPAADEDCPTTDRLAHTELVDALESVTRWSREGPTLALSSPTGTRVSLLSRAG